MHATHKKFASSILALSLSLASAAALAASAPGAPPAGAAAPASTASPTAPPAKAAAPTTLGQYLRQLPPAEQAEAKAIMAKRSQARQELRAKIRVLGDETRALWRQPNFDQAKFRAKGKELGDLGLKLGLLRFEELAELRARFGPNLPMPKQGR
ncbi:MAG: periplasmic heavy metal sensor [Thermodesulfobacteriota bacterium]